MSLECRRLLEDASSSLAGYAGGVFYVLKRWVSPAMAYSPTSRRDRPEVVDPYRATSLEGVKDIVTLELIQTTYEYVTQKDRGLRSRNTAEGG